MAVQEYGLFGFEDLDVYQAARDFRNRVLTVAAGLPVQEKYGLSSQMKRAAMSITNNIAEGYGRFTWQDTTHFFHMARGSVAEVVDDLSACLDMKLLQPDNVVLLRQQAVKVNQLINGYIRYLQRKKERKDR